MAAEADLGGLEIRSERLILRAYRAADAPEIFAQITPTLARWMDWEPADSLETLQGIFAGIAPATAAGREVPIVIRLAKTGRFIGMTGLHDLDTDEPRTGIWIREDEHRRGYGREAVAAAVRWAGEALGLPALYYPVVEMNTPSRRLAEALGGVVIGRGLQRKADVENPMVVYRIPAAARP